MDHKKLRSADILSSIVLIIIGVAVCINSARLILDNPDTQHRFYVSAGLVPLIFGILLIITSTTVLINGIKDGGNIKIFSPGHIWKAIRSEAGLTTIFIYAWIGIYIFVFLRILPYFISTLLFMVIFMMKFYSKHPVAVLVISVLVSGITTYIFGSVVNIPLPGM